jgi:hypothetical protein
MIAEVKNPKRRAALALGGTFLVYAATVAPYEGEFWPFSIFPMFSRAGKTWTRAMVLDVSALQADHNGELPGWGPWTMDSLPGKPISTRAAKVSTNDLSKYIQRTKEWTDERREGLRTLFASALADGRTLLVLRVTGAPAADGGVTITLTGLVKMNSQEVVVNPTLA